MNIVVYCGANDGIDQKWLDVAKTVGKWIAENGNTLVARASNSGMMLFSDDFDEIGKFLNTSDKS